MPSNAILDRLRERISCLEETQRRFARTIPVADAVDHWLPHGGLSAGCIHEIKGSSLAGAIALSSTLSSRLALDHGHILYISPDRSLNPLGLLPYGARLDQMLHISVRRSQHLSWAVLEALRCSQVSAVVAVLQDADLTESRRLQMAAENSGATGFFIGTNISASIASPVTRWKISSTVGKPGQRFNEPVWVLDLLYCRGGRPGSWTVEWRNGKLTAINQPIRQHVREALAG